MKLKQWFLKSNTMWRQTTLMHVGSEAGDASIVRSWKLGRENPGTSVAVLSLSRSVPGGISWVMVCAVQVRVLFRSKVTVKSHDAGK